MPWIDADGRSDFNVLQSRLNDACPVRAFDLLELNGEDYRKRPLLERKQILKDVVEQRAPNAERKSSAAMVLAMTWEEASLHEQDIVRARSLAQRIRQLHVAAYDGERAAERLKTSIAQIGVFNPG